MKNVIAGVDFPNEFLSRRGVLLLDDLQEFAAAVTQDAAQSERIRHLGRSQYTRGLLLLLRVHEPSERSSFEQRRIARHDQHRPVMRSQLPAAHFDGVS